MGGACGTPGRAENSYRVLVGNHEVIRPLSTRRLEDNIKMGNKERGWNVVDLIDLVCDRASDGLL